MDGISETEIIHGFGSKWGSAVGDLQPVGSSFAEVQLDETPSFHFPYAQGENPPDADPVETVSVATIMEVIQGFDAKVQGDNFFLSTLLIRVKEAVNEVLTIKAKYETNTGLQEDVTCTLPSPFEFGVDGQDSNTLARKKSWYEKMQDAFSKRTVRDNERMAEKTDTTNLLERTLTTSWVGFNERFDGDALSHLLGAGRDVNTGKKKRKRQALKRPKIGSSRLKTVSTDSSSGIRSAQVGGNSDRENIDLNLPYIG